MSEVSGPGVSDPLAARQLQQHFRAILGHYARLWSQTARAATNPQATAAWAAYECLLLACMQVVLDAPLHPHEARRCQVNRRLEHAEEILATALAHVLPGGIEEELTYYVMDASQRTRRRRRGLRLYRHATITRRRV